MRRALSFAVSTSILAAGLYLLYAGVIEADVIRGGFVVGGGFATFFGAMWLWEEITDPTT